MLATNDSMQYYSAPPPAPPVYVDHFDPVVVPPPPPQYFSPDNFAQPYNPPVVDFQPQYQPGPTYSIGGGFDDTRTVMSDTWTLALSEVTVNQRGEPAPLNLLEELLLLKAGDCAKFSRANPTLDRILAAALILELAIERKVGIEGDGTGNPRNLVLQVLDDTPTGSNLINSAIQAIRKRGNKPFTIQTTIDKIANSQQGGLASKILWRLVKKGKCTYDPRTFGADKYPVIGGASDVQNLRERIIRVMDRSVDQFDVRDLCLAFLYYLPKNSSERVFGGQASQGGYVSELFHICRSISLNIQEYKSQRSWI